MKRFAQIPSLSILFLVQLIAPPLRARVINQPQFGSFQQQFTAADGVIAGQVSTEDRLCSADMLWDPAKQGSLCTESVVVDRVYKGTISHGEVISVQYGRYLPMDERYRHLAQGEYALFVLCKSSSGFVYCPGTLGRSLIVKPPTSSTVKGRSGLDLLAWDLVGGLTGTDYVRQNIDLLWAIGSTRYLADMEKVESILPVDQKTDLDALLIRSEPSKCGADLSQVSKLSTFPGDMLLMAAALNDSGSRCLGQAKFLAESPSLALRMSSLHILGIAKDPKTLPLLATLVDDKEPGVAFNAMRVLETITGAHLIKDTSFADFDSKPEIRENLTAAWKSQLRSQGVVSEQ